MAVYTNVDDDALADFLEAYDLGTVLSFAGIAEGVENSNYLLRTDRAHYILTLYEKRVDSADLPFFIEVMQVLAESGLNCPLPVTARDGSILQELQGRPCAIFTFLDGTWSRFPNREKCTELGRTLEQRIVLKGGPHPILGHARDCLFHRLAAVVIIARFSNPVCHPLNSNKFFGADILKQQHVYRLPLRHFQTINHVWNTSRVIIVPKMGNVGFDKSFNRHGCLSVVGVPNCVCRIVFLLQPCFALILHQFVVVKCKL